MFLQKYMHHSKKTHCLFAVGITMISLSKINVHVGSSLCYHPETHTIYLFGGWNGGHFDGNVYRIQVDDWHWQKVEIEDGSMKPSGRSPASPLCVYCAMCLTKTTLISITNSKTVYRQGAYN